MSHQTKNSNCFQSNDKLELTEKLQSEIHKCKEMTSRLEEMEEDVRKWKYKEEEMIRLSHENTELEKKILQQNIEIDRLRHYESKGLVVTGESAIEKELENAKHLIEVLTNKINLLEGKEHHHQGEHSGHSHHHNHGHSHENDVHSDTKCLKNEIDMLKQEKAELMKIISAFKIGKKSSLDVPEETQAIQNESPEKAVIENGNVNVDDEKQEGVVEPKENHTTSAAAPSIATEEALEKLQARFRRTMLEVADLTDEKQRLEHLVTQLQFETETIGEYITLYQYQRRLLKQKDLERDIQLRNLAADREKMNEKLTQLNSLIEKYILQHNSSTTLPDNGKLVIEHENMNGENVEANIVLVDAEKSKNKEDVKILAQKQETAGKIMEILSDIKTANAKNYDNQNICVEHCSCCLGKLETV